MHKLRRMHIANAGYKDAFFEGETWEFYDRETGEPVDAVLFANNGVGKTTSLSLLFSVMDTPTNRFMRHLTQSHCHFEDYFNDEPALIAIEWDCGLDTRKQKLAPLVTAQIVVTRREGGEKRLERIFICFKGNQQFGFDSLPFTGLGKTTHETRLKTRDEVQRWVSERVRQYAESHSFVRADRQSDWRIILEENGIDVMLISKQVDLNKREANTQEFLEFPNERAFLDKFLSLTLNEERTRLVRENLLEGVMKLGDYDVYMERLKAMRGLEQRHSTFRYAAARYLEIREDLQEVQAEAAGLRAALNERKQILASRITGLEEEKKERANWISQAIGTLKELKADLAACDLVNRRRAAEKAAGELSNLESAKDAAKRSLSHLDAALDWKPIEKLAGEIRELQNVLAIEEKSLEEPKRLAEAAGSELVAVLEWHIGEAKRELLQRKEQYNAFGEKKNESRRLMEAADKELNDEMKKQGELDQWFGSFDRVRLKLVSREDLQEGESSATAMRRCESEFRRAEEEGKSIKASVEAIEALVRDLASTINQLTALEAIKQGEHASLLLKVNEGRDKKKSLLENSCLVRVCRSESVDLESSAVETSLQEFRNEASRRMIQTLREIETKESDVASIKRAGLAGIDENAHLVAEYLKSAGIRGAKPYAVWLAELKWEPSFLREFARSDPARFCGVAVQGDDAFEQAKGIALSGISLSRPVVVSLAVNELGQVPPTSFVIPVERDEAYDTKAAEILAENIAQQILDLRERHLQAGLDHDMAGDVLDDVAHFLKNWGKGQLTEMESRYSALQNEIAQIQTDLDENRRLLTQAHKEKQEREARWNKLEKLKWELKERSMRLNDFHDTWERHHETKTTDRDRILKNLGELENRRSLLKSGLAKIDSEIEQARDEINAENRKIKRLETELDGVQMRGTAVPTPPNPEMLDDFKVRYAQREENFKKIAAGQYATIRTSLDEKMKFKEASVQLFGKKHKHCEREEVYRLVGLANIERLREKAEKEHSELVDLAAEKRSERKKLDGEFQNALDSASPVVRRLAEELSQIPGEKLDEREEQSRTEQRKLERQIPESQNQLQEVERELQTVSKEETACNSFLSGFPIAQSERRVPVNLEFGSEPLGRQVEALRDRLEKAQKDETAAHGEASRAYDPVRSFVARDEFRRLELRISGDLNQNNPEDAMTQASSHARLILDMISSLEYDLNKKDSESQLIREGLHSLLNESLAMLRRACESGKIPASIPRLGGEPVLKMGKRIGTASRELKEQMIKGYLAEMIRAKEVPKTGNELAGELIDHLRGMMNLESLDIKIIKPTDMGSLIYERIHRAVASGGEGLTAAILLYLVLSRLRSIARGSNTLGGFLIADNPFGAVTHNLFLRTQRELARAMNIQLIFTSHVKDYNALAEFPHIINYSKRQQRQDRILIRLAHENIGEPQ